MENRQINLLTALNTCEDMVNQIKKVVIEEAGVENRVYTDDEEYSLERLDEAVFHIKKAVFEIQRLKFNMHKGSEKVGAQC